MGEFDEVWPAGCRAGLSISFDDARPSQVERGVPVLQRHGLKATFFVLANAVQQRYPLWQGAVRAGHEIGAHTESHPCSGNFIWSRENALESYTLERMDAELHRADADIHRLFGTVSSSFAYPCGQKFVGRAAGVQSYVPLVARRYEIGRGYRDEAANDPLRCDFAQVLGVGMDGMTFETIRAHVDEALETGTWLVLVAHEVSDQRMYDVMGEAELNELCLYASAQPELMVDTIGSIGRLLRSRRDSRQPGAHDDAALG